MVDISTYGVIRKIHDVVVDTTASLRRSFARSA
jgi:hypothetical protein